ncbi:MAG TPA: CPBP family intramembrane glutamic endopeptidase [Polyangia bacterium]|nr:CPBP family intramembrane glutamic endopeptidase [Polyangia bacterium]
MASTTTTRTRALELAVVFVLSSALLTLGPRWAVSLGILGSGIAAAIFLRRDPTFPRGSFFDVAAMRPGLRRVLVQTAAIWIALLVVTVALTPKTLFLFPRLHPGRWAIVMTLYPISAYAQELVFRTFFFHRYGSLFSRPSTRVLASGVLFGLAHVVVNNWIAVGLAIVAGVIFAATYERTKSTLLVSFEHALYGDFVFSVGLGALFYSPARWVAH